MNQSNGLTSCVFGSLGVVGGLLLAVTPIGQNIPNRGIFGALNVPVWVLGLAVAAFAVALLVHGIKLLRRGDD